MYTKLLSMLLPFVFLANSVFASWHDHWIKATVSQETREYQTALTEMDLAISEMSKEEIQDNPHVYVDRARAFAGLKRYEEAIFDVNESYKIPSLQTADREIALLTEMNCYCFLGKKEEALATREKLFENSPILNIAVYDDKVIVRNIPESECSRKMIKNFVVAAYCENEEDVKIIGNTCIGKKANCNCDKAIQKVNGNVAACKEWCDDMSFAGMMFCAGTFNNAPCQIACQGAVFGLTKACRWCCDGGNFYGKCVKPFEDILAAMGGGCVPGVD